MASPTKITSPLEAADKIGNLSSCETLKTDKNANLKTRKSKKDRVHSATSVQTPTTAQQAMTTSPAIDQERLVTHENLQIMTASPLLDEERPATRDKPHTTKEVMFRSRISTIAFAGRNLCIVDERSSTNDGFSLDYHSITVHVGFIREEPTAINDLVIVRISDFGRGGSVSFAARSSGEGPTSTTTTETAKCAKRKADVLNGIKVAPPPAASFKPASRNPVEHSNDDRSPRVEAVSGRKLRQEQYRDRRSDSSHSGATFDLSRADRRVQAPTFHLDC